MLNLNFHSNPQAIRNNGLPSFGGFTGTMPGMPVVSGFDSGLSGMQSLLSQAMNVMTALMAQMMAQQTALMGGTQFGNSAGSSQLSPLSSFLGGADTGSSGNLLQNYVSKSKGKKIPGGASLYKGRGMFHKGAPGAPDTYAFENSPAGIAFAAKHGYSSIDIDMQITKDGVPVATHWSKPMKKDGFYDPLGKLSKNKKVSDMTLAEVMRLRNKDGQSRIYPMSTIVKELKKHGIAGSLEAKDDKRFATDRVMGYLADLVRDSGIKANLQSIDRGPRAAKILKTAQDHGFWARFVKVQNGHRKNWGYA